MSSLTVVYESGADTRGYKTDERAGEIRNLLPPSARLPNRPGDNIPNARTPMPTTTEQNKKTNVGIPYARRSGESITPFTRGPAPGDFVLVHRGGSVGGNVPQAKSFSSIYTIEAVNKMIDKVWTNADCIPVYPDDDTSVAMTDALVGIRLPRDVSMYSPDGVVLVISESISAGQSLHDDVVNVVVAGPVVATSKEGKRMCMDGERPPGWLYCGLRKTPVTGSGFKLSFELFSATQIRTKSVKVDGIVKYWRIGRLMDANAVAARGHQKIQLNLAISPPVVEKSNKTYNIRNGKSVFVKGCTAAELLVAECGTL